MAKKKKKMTPAQAAAARKSTPKRKYTPPAEANADPKDKRSVYTLIIPIVAIALIVVFSVVFTVLPGMMMS